MNDSKSPWAGSIVVAGRESLTHAGRAVTATFKQLAVDLVVGNH